MSDCPKCGGEMVKVIPEGVPDRPTYYMQIRVKCSKCGYETWEVREREDKYGRIVGSKAGLAKMGVITEKKKESEEE